MDGTTRQMLRTSGRRIGFPGHLPPQAPGNVGPGRETRDPTRPSPVPIVLLRFCLGWCRISHHARTMPPDSLLLCAQKMQTFVMECLGSSIEVAISPKNLASCKGFRREGRIWYQGPGAPLSSCLSGLQQQHSSPLQRPLGLLQCHTRPRCGCRQGSVPLHHPRRRSVAPVKALYGG